MQLNKTIVWSANLTFRISSNLSIRSVNLNILLGFNTFHIVLLNILFLIYLANIDKLGLFFNNVTNVRTSKK